MKWFDDANSLYPKGAEICRHPFFDTQSFYGLSRRAPIFSPPDLSPLSLNTPEDFCAFCTGRLSETTPEKNRILFKNNEIHHIPYPKLEFHDDILFRRQGNLFEIISFEYWHLKYGIESTLEENIILEEFFAQEDTKTYILEIIKAKFSRIKKDISTLTLSQKKEEARAFFSGFHELLTSGQHYLPNAKTKNDLFMSGSMSFQEHRVSYEEICVIQENMIKRNPYIKYISTFQNWLDLAGASFEHWHKQILASDFWGKPLLREMEAFRSNTSSYTLFALNTAIENNFIIAENEYALAYIEVGSKVGCIVIASKSQNLQPHLHSVEEIHGMSDLVHSVCACLGSSTPYNEEWFYTPFDAANFKTPWRVLINLRNGIEAGFEHSNQYLVSSISQRELADTLREKISLLKHSAPGVQAVSSKPEHKNILRYLG